MDVNRFLVGDCPAGYVATADGPDSFTAMALILPNEATTRRKFPSTRSI